MRPKFVPKFIQIAVSDEFGLVALDESGTIWKLYPEGWYKVRMERVVERKS